MTVALALAIVFYSVGIVANAINSAMGYFINKPEDWYTEKSRREGREKQLYWARAFRLSWVWPVLLIEPLKRIIKDGREETP